MKRGFFLVVFCALLAFTLQANAYSITPSSPTPLTIPEPYASSTSTAVIDAYISSTYGVTEIYKSNFVEAGDGNGSDEKSFAGSYNTTFFPIASDPSEATITWVSGTDYINTDPIYLLVKDGKNGAPPWFLFDISDWDGQETLYLTGFWEDASGAISHVSIYSGQPVPEPISMLLFGTGLVGVGGYVRRKFKK